MHSVVDISSEGGAPVLVGVGWVSVVWVVQIGRVVSAVVWAVPGVWVVQKWVVVSGWSSDDNSLWGVVGSTNGNRSGDNWGVEDGGGSHSDWGVVESLFGNGKGSLGVFDISDSSGVFEAAIHFCVY